MSSVPLNVDPNLYLNYNKNNMNMIPGNMTYYNVSGSIVAPPLVVNPMGLEVPSKYKLEMIILKIPRHCCAGFIIQIKGAFFVNSSQGQQQSLSLFQESAAAP